LLIARRHDGWDALITALVALDERHNDVLNRVLFRCWRAAHEQLDDAGGLYALLTAEDVLEVDAAAEREDRRAALGYVSPASARAFLGLAQADKKGNLNVSKFGPKMAGCGGFINISQKAKSVVFVGSFTAGGLKVAVDDGNLRIVQEGKVRKFIDTVEQLTFSGDYARSKGLPVLYITERCVFTLHESGLSLIEVAPGIDIEKDILANMDFKPIIEKKPRLMDERIFREGPMNLKEDLMSVPLKDRFKYNPERNIFFVNLEGFFIRRTQDIQEMEELAMGILVPLNKKVFGIVNYDNFMISPDLVDEYSEMVKRLNSYYSGVSRYTTSTFLRMKLGDALEQRGVAPHIYENGDEARRALGI
ncbi:MAG: hypothetical protein RQ767_05980, partial [Thermovirgaceae bacterium]|nr:hypothetical protein [Thermovirgaceae bacterium]